MVKRGDTVIAIYRQMCEQDLWQEELGMDEESAHREGLGILDIIFNTIVKGHTDEELSAKWRHIRHYNAFGGRNRYGGNQETNYRLRQMSTMAATPTMRQLRRIGGSDR